MSQDNLKVFSDEARFGRSGWFEVFPLQAASEATRTSGLYRSSKAKGLIIQTIVNNVAATPTFAPTILIPSGDTSLADEVLASFTAIGSSGSVVAVFHPEATGMGDTAIAGTLPSEFKIALVYAGADTTNVADTHVYARYIE